jgi:hypothetical protein
VQHAADTAAGEEHDLAGHEIGCACNASVDRPRETVRTYRANGRRATLRNDDVGLIDDLGVASGCDAVLELGIARRNGSALRICRVSRRSWRPARAAFL